MGQVHFEIPTGAVNGVNVVFVLAFPYVPGSTAVFINGQLKTRELDDGWLESGPGSGEITLKEAPTTGDTLQVFYQDTEPPLPETVVTDIKGAILDAEEDLTGVLLFEDSILGSVADFVEVTGLFIDDEIVVMGEVGEEEELFGTIFVEEGSP